MRNLKYGGLVQVLPFSYTITLIGSLSLMGFTFMDGFYSGFNPRVGFCAIPFGFCLLTRCCSFVYCLLFGSFIEFELFELD